MNFIHKLIDIDIKWLRGEGRLAVDRLGAVWSDFLASNKGSAGVWPMWDWRGFSLTEHAELTNVFNVEFKSLLC